MNLHNVFLYSTCLIKLPNELFRFDAIPSYWKTNNLNVVPDKLHLNKHRCPNCGATKQTADDCLYCGT